MAERERGFVEHMRTPVDGASLAVFRFLFGMMMVWSVLRFGLNGWITDLYVTPSFHFTYYGWSWVQALSPEGMVALFWVIGLSALGIALGFYYRASCAIFLVSFSYLQLIDKATYLNHYYLVCLLAAVMLFMPLHHTWSIDALRARSKPLPAVPRWALWSLRLQVGLVYFFAGVAKLQPDWLLRGEPLAIWFRTRAELPLLGPLLQYREVAIGAAWAGMLFDLLVAFALLYKRTRALAFAGVVAFHTLTGLLFPIGLFPVIMSCCATVFFEPEWPRRFWGKARIVLPQAPPSPSSPMARMGLAVLAAHLAVQVLLPLRHHLYPGNTCWNEEGYRFAWHVMLTEKTGQVEYLVRSEDGRSFVVHPRRLLTPLQVRMLSTQPDMILELAQHVAREEQARLGQPVAVYADARVAMNGRRSRYLVDPRVDLSRVRDGFAPKAWITQPPAGL